MKLKILHLFPEALNLYGDGGNIIALMKRCEWRGIEVELQTVQLQDDLDIDLNAMDILFIGGGSDREQKIANQKLCGLKKEIAQYVDNNGVILAICGGYQLLGQYYKTADGETVNGVGLLDIITESGDKRLIGNVIIQSELFTTPIVGFENHIGCTYINDHTPLGKVVVGYGNNGIDQKEGICYKNVFGTYLHGSLLPKNPLLTDLILKRAIERRTSDYILQPLDDTIEQNAHKVIMNRFG